MIRRGGGSGSGVRQRRRLEAMGVPTLRGGVQRVTRDRVREGPLITANGMIEHDVHLPLRRRPLTLRTMAASVRGPSRCGPQVPSLLVFISCPSEQRSFAVAAAAAAAAAAAVRATGAWKEKRIGGIQSTWRGRRAGMNEVAMTAKGSAEDDHTKDNTNGNTE